jgi:hypothetical protein
MLGNVAAIFVVKDAGSAGFYKVKGSATAAYGLNELVFSVRSLGYTRVQGVACFKFELINGIEVRE